MKASAFSLMVSVSLSITAQAAPRPTRTFECVSPSSGSVARYIVNATRQIEIDGITFRIGDARHVSGGGNYYDEQDGRAEWIYLSAGLTEGESGRASVLSIKLWNGHELSFSNCTQQPSR